MTTEVTRDIERVKNLRAARASLTSPAPSLPPNIIDFVTGPAWLNKPNLYPRQATMLKVIFLQDRLFTQFDYQVIAEWTRDFKATGNRGIAPDVMERIRINKAEGRKWFREVDAIIGRRGGKGYLGALCGAYVLWHFLVADYDGECYGNPQDFYGIDSDKRLTAMVFGGKLAQAKANLWRDLVTVIEGAPCFEPYLGRAQSGSLTIKSPADFAREAAMVKRGRKSGMDLSTFEIVPKESTALAGRGPASFMQLYDEMAHVVNSGSNRSAEEVYQAATPALDQFGQDGFIFVPSSPWQKAGQFYENCQHALELDEVSGAPRYPEMLLIQLTSWDPYQDWRLTNIPNGMIMRAPLSAIPDDPLYDPEYALRHRAGLVPEVESLDDVPRFKPLRSAVQECDEQMRRLEMANPATFAVERRSHWAATMDAYLNETRVDDIFAPYRATPLEMQSRGQLSTTYKMHGDPSKSGANFGLSIAHVEKGEDGWDHVVFDFIHAWRPKDFPENRYEVDYRIIENDLKGYVDAFHPDEVSFDQFNSVHTIQELRAHVRTRGYPKRVQIFERTATRALNWEVAETAKTAINLGLVHAPYFELAELELKFLQDQGGRVDHPSSGPVQTKDVADTMMILIHALIGDQMKAFIAGELAATSMRMSQPGGAAAAVGYGGPVDPHAALSGFGRDRRDGHTGSPARGRNAAYGGTPRQRRDQLFGRRPRW